MRNLFQQINYTLSKYNSYNAHQVKTIAIFIDICHNVWDYPCYNIFYIYKKNPYIKGAWFK